MLVLAESQAFDALGFLIFPHHIYEHALCIYATMLMLHVAVHFS